MKKRICFVVDKKGEDILAPQFVTNHSAALRMFMGFNDNSDKEQPMFVRFPEDYLLVTCDLSFSGSDVVLDSPTITPFVDFIKQEA